MKRESDTWSFPFAKGGFKDPLWEPTFRFMALWPYVVECGKTRQFLSAFARGVYCQGIDFGTDRGVQAIVEAAGLDYETCVQIIDKNAADAIVDGTGDDTRLLKEPAQTNAQVMLDAGLWGVPCLRYGNTFVWGQDRLWAIEAAILSDLGMASGAHKL